MKTFKQFIAEGWKGDSDGARWHEHEIDGQKVVTSFSTHHGKKQPRKHGKYSVDFSVNGQVNDHKEVKDAKTRVEILHHVHKVVSHFIKKKNPKLLSMSGNSDKKRNLYAHVANRLAKQHGGKVEHDVMDTFVKFRKKKS